MIALLLNSEIFTEKNIASIEEVKNAVYVCETCLRTKGGWQADNAVAIFWNKDPANVPEGGSRWFGLYFDMFGQLMIANAISAVEEPITGVIAANGDIIYSKYRHDYRISEDGTAMIDGGRDYFRTGPFGIGTAELRIIEGELKVRALHYHDKANKNDMGAHPWKGD